ncbi:MAG TPA: RagB/SusD family nutrient uptake outer membrane protein [Saprospiraceae bacterium]|nr:RagB/SusD family nutrient uptake outer membrane protein [Saprospiraceae bacterium]
MKTRFYIKTFCCIVLISLFGTSCFNDLDTIPLDKDLSTANVVFNDPSSYLAVLAKVYAGLAVSGQQGPAGQADIQGIDEGFGQYLRGYWYHQELPTDEAVIGWNDQTIRDFHDQDWTADDGFIFAFYSRIFYQIVLCNEYLRETADAKLAERGVDAALAEQIRGYRAEVRFLRALSYWHALDLFRNVPFVTENDAVGSTLPIQIQGPDLFNYIESELLAIENEIAPAGTNPYGRADQGAVWTLLAKLYLNAEVYTGAAKYGESLIYSNKVINSVYTLEPIYQNLFLADNNLSNEIIFPITFDGNNTRTWGGTTFVVRAGIGGSMNPVDFGVVSGWGGTRTTKQFVEKFPVSTDLIVAPNEGKTATYTKIYVPGEYQGWNGTNTKTALTSPLNNKIYEGHVYFPEANSPFFFTLVPSSSFAQRVGDNGGDGTLEMNGDTIRAGAPGLYYIRVDRNTNTYILEPRTWGIIGDATPNGWVSDLDMTWNPATEAMEINVDLTEGDFKFRANDDWVVNLGDPADTANISILAQDGPNIHIGAGSYLIRLFIDKPDYTYEIRLTSFDRRGLFHTSGQNIEINDLTVFTDGYAVKKFKNVTSTGAPGSNTDFPDTDFPMFRLADVLLMASEAILRSGGDRGLALDYFNRVRTRAYLSPGGNISDADLTLQTILDERARELYWEAHRRTDLIRFGKFSQTDYLWAWKGGVPGGKSVDAYRDIFPLPSADLGANTNLEQNDGY